MSTTFVGSSTPPPSSSFDLRKTYWVHRFVPLRTPLGTPFINLSSGPTKTTTKERERNVTKNGEETRAETEYRTLFVSYLLRWKIECAYLRNISAQLDGDISERFQHAIAKSQWTDGIQDLFREEFLFLIYRSEYEYVWLFIKYEPRVYFITPFQQ